MTVNHDERTNMFMPMLDTRGRKLLEGHLRNSTQVEIAHALGVGQSAVSHWVRGASRPEAHHRLALRLLFGIPQRTWMTTEESALVRRVRADVKARKLPDRTGCRPYPDP